MKPGGPENEFRPRGTLAVLLIYAAIILAIWLAIYFGIFQARG